jgi:hypothetical protein
VILLDIEVGDQSLGILGVGTEYYYSVLSKDKLDCIIYFSNLVQ